MTKFFQYLRTTAFRKNLIYAIIVFVSLFLLLYFGLRIYTKHGDRQEVPVLKGLHISEAINILHRSGLKYEVDSIYQLDAQPGLVVEQDPEAAAFVKSGRTIYLTIITQVAPEIAFPEIVDKTLVEAMAIIRNNSLKVGDTTYVNDIARDVVLEARFGGRPLGSGVMVSKGSRVDLVLGNGRGAEEIDIPNLVGMPYTEAEFALRGLGLVVGAISFEDGTQDTLNSVVIRQNPGVEQQFLPLGSAVHLTLSNSSTSHIENF